MFLLISLESRSGLPTTFNKMWANDQQSQTVLISNLWIAHKNRPF
jgi:hypothetical protein